MPTARPTPILLVARGLDPVGSGRQLELLAEGLLRAGRDLHLAVTSAGGSVPRRLAARGVAVHRIGTRPVVDIAAMARLIGLVGRLRPAAVLGWGRSQLVPVAAVRVAGSSARVIGRIATPIGDRRTAWALRRLDLVIASSPGVAASCGPLTALARPPEVIPPGIMIDTCGLLPREEVAARLGLDPGKIWTLCVAPLVPRSRLERLVWAIDQLGVVHKGLEHVLVGSGPLLQRVRSRAHVQQLAERLFMMPHCDLLPDLLGHVQLVWQSGEVAHGGAILDAMARGIPAVAVESEAARQLIVDGETGRIVPPLPESELPRRAFGTLEDGSLAARYAAAARDRAATEFPAERMVAAHVAAIERLIEGPSVQP